MRLVKALLQIEAIKRLGIAVCAALCTTRDWKGFGQSLLILILKTQAVATFRRMICILEEAPQLVSLLLIHRPVGACGVLHNTGGMQASGHLADLTTRDGARMYHERSYSFENHALDAMSCMELNNRCCVYSLKKSVNRLRLKAVRARRLKCTLQRVIL